MILFLAGTSDSRKAAQSLKEAGFDFVLSTVSTYGRILAEAEGLNCREGALGLEDIQSWIQVNQVDLIIDGTHPYAVNASKIALEAAEKEKISYIRLERPERELPQEEWLHPVETFEEAAKKAFEVGKSVLLTTGSRTLKIFKECQPEEVRLVARILSEPNGIEEARDLGFLPRDIIGMEGPFSKEMNVALINHVGADVMVMKNSGDAGGTFEKLAACESKKIQAVVIERPKMKFPHLCEDSDSLIQMVKGLKDKPF